MLIKDPMEVLKRQRHLNFHTVGVALLFQKMEKKKENCLLKGKTLQVEHHFRLLEIQ